MKKVMVDLLLLGGLLMLFVGWTKKTGEIYTGLPDKEDGYYQPFKKDIKNFHHALKSQKVAYGDIWIRDVAPVITNHLVKFKYAPDYLPKKQSSEIDKTFRNWLDDEGFDYVMSDIVLDGGNFIYNGKDTVIMTNKVLTENPEYKKTELIDELKKILQVSKIIFIEREPGDVLGHADGQVHFIQSDVLFIGDFESKKAVKARLKKVLPQVKMVDLPSNYQEAGQYDEKIPSAKGLYINMMDTESNIYVPQYGLKQDKKVLDLVSKYTDKKIHAVDVSKLSTLGGSVNCLTWYCPEKFLS